MLDIYDIIIIGGGPAGLSAAIYSSRARYKTLIIEKLGFGGQMMLTDIIDNYPGYPGGITGFELQEKMVSHMNQFGTEQVLENVVGIEKENNYFIVKTENNKSYHSYSVILATGAKHRNLQIPGEKKFRSKGVSYCGTCDGPFFKDKNVIVIGGGDTAITESLFLAKFAKQIKIIHRKDRFRAVQSLVEKTDNMKNVSYIFDSILTEIKGDTNVNSVIVENIKTNTKTELETDGVFIFIGLVPNTSFIDKSLLDNENYIITDNSMKTKISGLFAAGDVRSGTFRQIICAASNGACASENVQKYVDELKGVAYK